MKYLIICLLALSMLGCTGKTRFGDCIGLQQDKNPKLEYELHGWNIFWGVIFSETLVVPAIVVLDRIKCPIGEKK